MLRAIEQKPVATANWRPVFVHPWRTRQYFVHFAVCNANNKI
jgi:hypothetical protein